MTHQNSLMWTYLSYDAKVGNFLTNDHSLYTHSLNHLNNFQILIPNDCQAIFMDEDILSKIILPGKEGGVNFDELLKDFKNVYQIYKSDHPTNQLYSSLSDIVNAYFTTNERLFKRMSFKCGSIVKLKGFYKNTSHKMGVKSSKKSIFCQFTVLQGIYNEIPVTQGLEMYVPLSDQTKFLPLKLCKIEEISGQSFDAEGEFVPSNELKLNDKQRNAYYDYSYSRKKFEDIRAQLLLYQSSRTLSDNGHDSYLLYYDKNDNLKGTTIYLGPRMEVNSLAIVTNFAFDKNDNFLQFKIHDSFYYTELWDSTGKEALTVMQNNTLNNISQKYQCKIEQLTTGNNVQRKIFELVKHFISVPKLFYSPSKIPSPKTIFLDPQNHDRAMDYFILKNIHQQPINSANNKAGRSTSSLAIGEVKNSMTDAICKMADSLYHTVIELSPNCENAQDPIHKGKKGFDNGQDHVRSNNDYFYKMGSLAEGLDVL